MNLQEISKFVPEYWEGPKNMLVRCWIYLENGLDLINRGRYLIVGILGLYYTLKLANWKLMGLMFFVSVPLLIVMGRYYLHRVSRIKEWVQVQFGSVLGYNGYNLQIKQVELLEKILEKLNDKSLEKN